MIRASRHIAGASLSVDLPIPAMTANDFIEAVRFTGGFGGLELRGAEARAGAARLTIANPTTATIDRAVSDVGVVFCKPILGT